MKHIAPTYQPLPLMVIGLFSLFILLANSSAQSGNELSTHGSPLTQPQQNEIVFRHLTIGDGLSDNSVYHLLQDRQGFIWATTVCAIKKYGGMVLGEELLPLSQTDYSPTIQRIETANPDFVFALPVGPNQNWFLEQFSAAGLKKEIGMVSTNYGSGNQQREISHDAGENIASSLEYFNWIEEPGNDAYKKLWKAGRLAL
ncbi:MAG: ABC transporter substrate-binding protein [Candidatus Thiodiazotropha sp. 6PLUC2]